MTTHTIKLPVNVAKAQLSLRTFLTEDKDLGAPGKLTVQFKPRQIQALGKQPTLEGRMVDLGTFHLENFGEKDAPATTKGSPVFSERVYTNYHNNDKVKFNEIKLVTGPQQGWEAVRLSFKFGLGWGGEGKEAKAATPEQFNQAGTQPFLIGRTADMNSDDEVRLLITGLDPSDKDGLLHDSTAPIA